MKRGERKKRFAICFLVFLCRWNHRYLTQIRTWASSREKTAFGWSTKYNANPLQFYLTLYPPLLSVLCFLHATCLFVSLCMCLWLCLCVCVCVWDTRMTVQTVMFVLAGCQRRESAFTATVLQGEYIITQIHSFIC